MVRRETPRTTRVSDPSPWTVADSKPGTRWGDKSYWWLERQDGAVCNVGGCVIEDAIIVSKWDTFADAVKELREIL